MRSWRSYPTPHLPITRHVPPMQHAQGVNETLIYNNILYKLGLWAMEPDSFWTEVRASCAAL